MTSEPLAQANTFHYTNKRGFDAVRSQPDWVFKAGDPSLRRRPVGIYFTDLKPTPENRRSLFAKIGLPRAKQTHVFWFVGREGLIRLNNGRGRDRYILYSKRDYIVTERSERQRWTGSADELTENFP